MINGALLLKHRSRRSVMLFVVLLSLSILLQCYISTPTSAISLTLNVSSAVSLDLRGATSTSGVFASSSTSDTVISVKTDNYTGYTLGIAASNSNVTALTSDGGSTIPSITSAIDESTFSSSTSYNNKWGYKPSKFNSSANTNYLPAPSASTSNPDTLDQTSSPNPTTANTYNIAIGARVNSTTAPGTYTNSYVITAVANGTPYTLTYNKNAGSDTVSNMPTNITNGVSYADTINLGTTTPTRTGYTFAGWCTSNSSQTSCSSTLYNSTNGNLASFPIDRTASSNDVNIYAIWTAKKYNLVITGDSHVSSMSVKAGSTSGATTNCTKSNTTFTCSNLTYYTRYYLYPVFSSGYEFSSYSKTDSATNSTLGSTTAVNTYYRMGDGNGAITLASKLSDYVITYNANSGTGQLANQTVTPGDSVTLRDNSFTRTNYYFKGWSTSSSATTPTYRTNQTITPSGNMTLYAVWGVSTNTALYDAVASLTRGTQTSADVHAEISKSNSGVYTYNSSVFGTSSDTSNSNSIYYYRGVLDNVTGTYGSGGDALDYPNYVVFGADSASGTKYCWRIVRTTGSKGVKLIYNGLYGATTSDSCGNTTSNTRLTTLAYGLKGNSSQSNWQRNVNRVGYTFNNSTDLQDSTTDTSVNTVFGSNSNPSLNNARSNIKTYIEDTWYATNMTSNTSKLEASAGYCNDRSAYSDKEGTTSLTTVKPYVSTNVLMYFGAMSRVSIASNNPSLRCPRSTVDLYRYVSGSSGLSNQLKYPAALLTADEAAFAGSGYNADSTPFNTKSYLRTGGVVYWLLSPYYRYTGNAYQFGVTADKGNLISNGSVNNNYGVRPVISLISGTKISSGSGTATSPWIIQ